MSGIDRERLAEALHRRCIAFWDRIDPTIQTTMHEADAHLIEADQLISDYSALAAAEAEPARVSRSDGHSASHANPTKGDQ